MRLCTRRRLLYAGLLAILLAPGCPSMCASHAYSRRLGAEGWSHVYDLPPSRVWPEVRAALAVRHVEPPERVPAVDEEVASAWVDQLNTRDRYRVTLASRFLLGGYRVRILREEVAAGREPRTLDERLLAFDVLERLDPARAQAARREAEVAAQRARASCQACWTTAGRVLPPVDAGAARP